MEIPINLLDKTGKRFPENPGDAIVVRKGEILTLIWCCPQCGKPTSSSKDSTHVFDPITKSLTPSIVHNKDLGGCGYHGFLTNGIFKDV